jgi:hypothetical protein
LRGVVIEIHEGGRRPYKEERSIEKKERGERKEGGGGEGSYEHVQG